jgi:hypothetical protein
VNLAFTVFGTQIHTRLCDIPAPGLRETPCIHHGPGVALHILPFARNGKPGLAFVLGTIRKSAFADCSPGDYQPADIPYKVLTQ